MSKWFTSNKRIGLLTRWNILLNSKTAVYYGVLQTPEPPSSESIDEWERRTLNLLVELTELQQETTAYLAIFRRKTPQVVESKGKR